MFEENISKIRYYNIYNGGIKWDANEIFPYKYKTIKTILNEPLLLLDWGLTSL